MADRGVLLGSALALVSAVALAAGLGAPWYQAEILPFARGQVVDVTGWTAFSVTDVALALLAAGSALFVLLGVAKNSAWCLRLAGVAGALSVGLILYRAVEAPGEGAIGDTGNVRELDVLWGLWASLAASVTIALASVVASVIVRSDYGRERNSEHG